VDCSSNGRRSQAVAVEKGIAAYAWLLGEGCDVGKTVFSQVSTGVGLVAPILLVATNRGLPIPAGIWHGGFSTPLLAFNAAALPKVGADFKYFGIFLVEWDNQESVQPFSGIRVSQMVD
jgi:hypothetical protein